LLVWIEEEFKEAFKVLFALAFLYFNNATSFCGESIEDIYWMLIVEYKFSVP